MERSPSMLIAAWTSQAGGLKCDRRQSAERMDFYVARCRGSLLVTAKRIRYLPTKPPPRCRRQLGRWFDVDDKRADIAAFSRSLRCRARVREENLKRIVYTFRFDGSARGVEIPPHPVVCFHNLVSWPMPDFQGGTQESAAFRRPVAFRCCGLGSVAIPAVGASDI